MHPVLHSSCSTPVPYAPGLTALEIDTSVSAGFPSPAEDFQAERIDVLKHIIVHPQATYTLRVRGDSMRDEGIFDGDVILVDRAIKPRHGHIVVAVVDGAFTCKKLWLRVGKLKLLSANPESRTSFPRRARPSRSGVSSSPASSGSRTESDGARFYDTSRQSTRAGAL